MHRDSRESSDSFGDGLGYSGRIETPHDDYKTHPFDAMSPQEGNFATRPSLVIAGIMNHRSHITMAYKL